MKKIRYIVLFIIIFMITEIVYAASANISLSNSSLYVGDSFTVTVNAYGAAAWNIHVSSSGPVSGCSINQADATADAMDTNKTFTANCTATGEGTIYVSLSGDVTSANDGIPVSLSDSRSVSVTTRPVEPSTPSTPSAPTTPSTPSTNNRPKANNKTETNPVVDTRSTNNNIKELSIDGHNLEKIDNNNYKLDVYNDVTSINIKAVPEDEKASITGAGNHELNVGENNIEVIVKAESGAVNKINIKVNRKDGYYLEDLDTVISKDIKDIIINNDTIISSSDLEKIKNSNKTINLNYYGEDKNLIYSWMIDGSKIDNIKELDTNISFDSDNKKEILKLSNYADGLLVNLKQSDIPKGTKIKLYVGNKYTDEDEVNVYAYDGDKLNIINKKIKVENGYLEFDTSNMSLYFLTMSTIVDVNEKIETVGVVNSKEELKKEDKKKSSIILPLIILLVVLLIGIIYFVIKRKKREKPVIDNALNRDSINTEVINNIPEESINMNVVDNISENNINQEHIISDNVEPIDSDDIFDFDKFNINDN